MSALACACIGPQNGEPLCPCAMRRAAARGGVSEMMERVARAIGEQQSARMAARYPTRFCYSGATWEQLSEGSKEDARLTARAAIEAMREPTKAMTDHFGDWMGDKPKDHEIARELWREAIDLALGVPLE